MLCRRIARAPAVVLLLVVLGVIILDTVPCANAFLQAPSFNRHSAKPCTERSNTSPLLPPPSPSLPPSTSAAWRLSLLVRKVMDIRGHDLSQKAEMGYDRSTGKTVTFKAKKTAERDVVSKTSSSSGSGGGGVVDNGLIMVMMKCNHRNKAGDQ